MSTIDAPEENSENNVPMIRGKPGDKDWMAIIYFDAVTTVAVQLEKIIPFLEASMGTWADAYYTDEEVLAYIEFREKSEEDQ